MANTNNNMDPSIYLGNPNLPSIKAEYEYTPEMLAEIRKCEDNIAHFAENHFFITTMDEGKKKIALYAPQKRILKSLGRHNRVTVLASRQTGKCVCKDTIIRIRNKQTLEVQELTIEQFHNLIKSKKE